MSRRRSHIGVGVIDGVMYAVGGTHGLGTHCKYVDSFRPSVGVWTPVADMQLGIYPSNYNIYVYDEYICKNITFF